MDYLSEVRRGGQPGSFPGNFSVVSFFLALRGSGPGFEPVRISIILDIWNRDMRSGYHLLFFAEVKKFPYLPADQR